MNPSLLPWLLGAVAFGRSQLWLVGALVLAASYLGLCAWWPYITCPSCSGKKLIGDGGGHFRKHDCRRCGGKGLVRRWGAIVIGRIKP